MNQVEFYSYTVSQPYGNGGRILEAHSLDVSFHLDRQSPDRLIKDRRGVIYYADDKGYLKYIPYDNSLENNKVPNTTT